MNESGSKVHPQNDTVDQPDQSGSNVHPQNYTVDQPDQSGSKKNIMFESIH